MKISVLALTPAVALSAFAATVPVNKHVAREPALTVPSLPVPVPSLPVPSLSVPIRRGPTALSDITQGLATTLSELGLPVEQVNAILDALDDIIDLPDLPARRDSNSAHSEQLTKLIARQAEGEVLSPEELLAEIFYALEELLAGLLETIGDGELAKRGGAGAEGGEAAGGEAAAPAAPAAGGVSSAPFDLLTNALNALRQTLDTVYGSSGNALAKRIMMSHPGGGRSVLAQLGSLLGLAKRGQLSDPEQAKKYIDEATQKLTDLGLDAGLVETAMGLLEGLLGGLGGLGGLTERDLARRLVDTSLVDKVVGLLGSLLGSIGEVGDAE